MSPAARDRFRLDGSLVLITGASSGLGEHFAELLAKAGGRIALTARRTDKLHALVEKITISGGEAVGEGKSVTLARVNVSLPI